jgi:hypothetical protein
VAFTAEEAVEKAESLSSSVYVVKAQIHAGPGTHGYSFPILLTYVAKLKIDCAFILYNTGRIV